MDSSATSRPPARASSGSSATSARRAELPDAVQGHDGLFRPAALERLSSPERLDTLVRIVGPKSWIPLVTIGVLVAAAATWGVLGRIPITASAKAVLLRPRTIRPVQAL